MNDAKKITIALMSVEDREFNRQLARLGDSEKARGLAGLLADSRGLDVAARYASILKAQRDKARSEVASREAGRVAAIEALKDDNAWEAFQILGGCDEKV